MIKLNDEWYIEADAYSYVLRKKYTEEEKLQKLEASKDKTKTLEDYDDSFDSYGYYPTIEGALNGYLKKCMREKVSKGKIADINTFLNELRALKEEIDSLISPLKKDISKPLKPTKTSKKSK